MQTSLVFNCLYSIALAGTRKVNVNIPGFNGQVKCTLRSTVTVPYNSIGYTLKVYKPAKAASPNGTNKY